MQTYSSHYNGQPDVRGFGYLQEHLDPYASTPTGGPSQSNFQSLPSQPQRHQPSLLAPPGLYTPSDRLSASRQSDPGHSASRRTSGADGGRRVIVNDVTSNMEENGANRYVRDASPPKRPPLVQPYQPPAALQTGGMLASTGAPQPPRTRGPGSMSQRQGASPHEDAQEQQWRSGSSPSLDLHSNSGITRAYDPSSGAAVRASRRQGPASLSEDSMVPMFASTSRPHSHMLADSLAEVATVGGGTTPSRASGKRSSHRGGDAPVAEDKAQTPVLDLFSGVEEHNAKEAKGPLAVSAKTIRGAKYVAQSAYTQHNPFRVQTFADFAAHPNVEPPEHFAKYPEAVGKSISVGVGVAGEGSRAMLGEFLVNRLVDLTQPMSEAERGQMVDLLNSTLEILQKGDWFYKWTRTNTVHRRFFWLNMQRGTLAWSPSPKQSLVWNSELKISEVTSVKPDCIRDATTGRSFYRMFISTADRAICLATEVPQKFDCWYKAVEQLTLPNLSSGVPGIWGRPTSVLYNGRRGAVGRWASRYSPLQAIADGTGGHLGGYDIRPEGRVSSSD